MVKYKILILFSIFFILAGFGPAACGFRKSSDAVNEQKIVENNYQDWQVYNYDFFNFLYPTDWFAYLAPDYDLIFEKPKGNPIGRIFSATLSDGFSSWKDSREQRSFEHEGYLTDAELIILEPLPDKKVSWQAYISITRRDDDTYQAFFEFLEAENLLGEIRGIFETLN